MVTVTFEDPAGRPVADAVVSIAGAPGEFRDIGMITDASGEIILVDVSEGIYDFAVFTGGSAHRVSTRVTPGASRITVVLW
mgnify:FL=1